MVRKFCLRMQFHSSSAYNELRKFFNNNLPSLRTIQRWLRTSDTSPGITSMAVDIISEKVKSYKDQGKQLDLCLISDEMSIRKQVHFNPVNKSFYGFVSKFNSENSENNNELAIAKDALVFMAVGPDFRIAVAYFLLNGLQGIDRAALTREVIKNVQKTGARIISLTSDGLPANFMVADLLGADFGANKPFFPNACHPGNKIYIIFDPSHMLKLLRKHFAGNQLYYGEEKLDWNLLKILAEKQDSDNFELGNKLSHRHINYSIAPMNVRLAVETFSKSVADVLQQLNDDGYAEFDGCDATVEFIQLINDIFDVTNYGEGKKTDDRFKQPLSSTNIDSVRELFKKGRHFIEKISIRYPNTKNKNVRPVLKSRAHTGFFGFIQNMTSTLGIYADYVESGQLNEFYPFQYSQDHLETYFSLIRSSLGLNNNPNEQQFSAAYRKLLLCVPHLSAGGCNCNIDHVNKLLTVSSAEEPALQQDQPNELEKEIEIGVGYDELLHVSLDPYEQHMCAFLASQMEQKIIHHTVIAKKSACQECSKVFGENPKINDSFIAKKNVAQPCSSTRNLVIVCDSFFKLFRSKQYIGFRTMSKTISKILDLNRLYEFSQFDSHQRTQPNDITHKKKFVISLVEEYMKMKSHKIGKRITIKEQGQNIRKRKTRDIILAGQ